MVALDMEDILTHAHPYFHPHPTLSRQGRGISFLPPLAGGNQREEERLDKLNVCPYDVYGTDCEERWLL